MRKPTIIITLCFIGIALLAQDTQWRGPARDGHYPDTFLMKEWPEEGPELILKKEGLGSGYSTPVIYKGDIFINGRRDSLEVLSRLNLQGEILWECTYGKAWDKSFQESRGTPTIENDRIYLMGGMGKVNCIDAQNGQIIWSKNTHEDFGGEFHRWGMAESLLLTDEAVISSPVGGQTAVVALDKKDGSVIWHTDTVAGVRSYVSPLLIKYQGREMIIMNSSEELFAVDPADGSLIWRTNVILGFTGTRNRRNLTNTPLYQDGEIYISSGYNAFATKYALSEDGNSIDMVWKNDTLDNHHGGMVLVDGYIYGANWENNGNGNWVCQDWESGKIMYEEKWINKGAIIYADGLLYLFEEKRGNVGLVHPSPEGFDLISSFRIEGGSGPYWAHPSIYDGKLLLRHGDVLFVYDLSK